jgi:hypothetical protein
VFLKYFQVSKNLTPLYGTSFFEGDITHPSFCYPQVPPTPSKLIPSYHHAFLPPPRYHRSREHRNVSSHPLTCPVPPLTTSSALPLAAKHDTGIVIGSRSAEPLNPQPLPPGLKIVIGSRSAEALPVPEPIQPQPLPPGIKFAGHKRDAEPLNPQPLPPGLVRDPE